MTKETVLTHVRERLKESFRDTVAASAGEEFSATGVQMPKDEVWDRYAQVAVDAFLKAAETDPEAAGWCENAWRAYLERIA